MKIISVLLYIIGGVMVLPLLVGVFYGETGSVMAFGWVVGATLAAGALIMAGLKASGNWNSNQVLRTRDAFLIVSISY